MLSAEQQAPVNAALNGKSIFLTGDAGTGKSFTLRQIIGEMHKKFSNRPGAVAVVAPTGAAAIQVEGTTIHRWAGIGIVTQEQAPKLAIWKREPWKKLHVLIIDEISMVADWMLNLLDRIGREARPDQRHLPFGGVQLILCGDFMQLSPIKGSYAFKSNAWAAAITRANCYELTYAYRHGNDHDFASMLAQVRLGKVDSSTLNALAAARKPALNQDIQPTRLYCKNEDVDAENMFHLNKLPEEATIYQARDHGPKHALDNVSSWSNAVTTLSLKTGAQVVLLKNINIQNGLVNGSRGVIVGFSDESKPVVRFAGDAGLAIPIDLAKWTLTKPDDPHIVIATRSQYPLALAWAITTHKAQGMSLDVVDVDLTKCFAYGMAYVALSRCRTLQGLSVKGLTASSIMTNKEALAFHMSIRRETQTQVDQPSTSGTEEAAEGLAKRRRTQE